MRVIDFPFLWRLNLVCLKLRQKEAAKMIREEGGQKSQLRISSGLTLETPNSLSHDPFTLERTKKQSLNQLLNQLKLVGYTFV